MKHGERERRNVALIAKVQEISELLLESKAISGIKTGFFVDGLDGIRDFGLALEKEDGGPFGHGFRLTAGNGIEALESGVSEEGAGVELQRRL